MERSKFEQEVLVDATPELMEKMTKEPKFVGLDSVVVVKSGINAAPNDDYTGLPALNAFLLHPARALSVSELSILMVDTTEEAAGEAMDKLVDDGLVVQTNELDGKQFRYRLI